MHDDFCKHTFYPTNLKIRKTLILIHNAEIDLWLSNALGVRLSAYMHSLLLDPFYGFFYSPTTSVKPSDGAIPRTGPEKNIVVNNYVRLCDKPHDVSNQLKRALI